jgi:hypothetical protein
MRFLIILAIPVSLLVSCTEKPTKKAEGATTVSATATTASATKTPPPAAATPIAESPAIHTPAKGTAVNPATLNLTGKWSVVQAYTEKDKGLVGKSVLNISTDKIIRQFGAKADTCTYTGAEKVEETFDAFLEGSNIKVANATPKITAVRLTGAGGECLWFGLGNKSILVWEDGGLFELQKK